MKEFKRIFVIGHPGAGKGLVAKLIAEKLGWQFINADFGLEYQIGLPIQQILGKPGLDNFNDCQNKILKTLLTKENIVVATDASIVCDEENRKILTAEFTVYIEVSIPVQLKRNARNPAPLLLDGNLEPFLNKLHQARDSWFNQVALLTIKSDDSAVEEHVHTIIKTLKADESNTLRQSTLSEKDLIIFHKKLHIPVHLTEQQSLCLKLLADGKTSKEIARELNISYRTVEGYIAKMIDQLGCSSSKDLIALYYDNP